MQVATSGLLLLLLTQTLLCIATPADQVPNMHRHDVILLLAVQLVVAATVLLLLQGNLSLPLRFWVDEYAFTPGETTLLREEIEVSWPTLSRREA